jgi:hypothetical protein
MEFISSVNPKIWQTEFCGNKMGRPSIKALSAFLNFYRSTTTDSQCPENHIAPYYAADKTPGHPKAARRQNIMID